MRVRGHTVDRAPEMGKREREGESVRERERERVRERGRECERERE